jgi:hypothetical protein
LTNSTSERIMNDNPTERGRICRIKHHRKAVGPGSVASLWVSLG